MIRECVSNATAVAGLVMTWLWNKSNAWVWLFSLFYLGRCFNWKFRNTFSVILSILACLGQKIIQFFSNIILQGWQRCLVCLCRIPKNLSVCCICCCCSKYIFKLFQIKFTKQETALLMELWNLSRKDNQLEKMTPQKKIEKKNCDIWK